MDQNAPASQLIKGLLRFLLSECCIRDESQNTATNSSLFWKHPATIHYQSTGRGVKAQRTHQSTLQAEELADMMTPF